MRKMYGVLVPLFAALFAVFTVQASMAQASGEQGSTPSSAAAPAWTIDQAVTCSVHDAWVLGGRSEDGFFAIVEALAQLSAEKRGLTLPDNSAIGRKFGLYIKTQAKADHDQLLYAIVDHAVRIYGKKPASSAATGAPAQN